MFLLAVDTGTKTGSVAVLRDGQLAGLRSSTAAQQHASGLFSDTDGLLAELGIPLRSLDLFAVSAGPGSFTGLRIGLTAVKAWAEVFGRPIVAASSLEALAVQVADRLPDGTIVAAVQDARRGQVYGGLFRLTGGLSARSAALGEEVLMPAAEFVEWAAGQLCPEPPVFVASAAEPIRSVLESSGLRDAKLQIVSEVLAPFIARIAYHRSLNGEVTDAMHLDANYVRRTDAEVKWEDRAGR